MTRQTVKNRVNKMLSELTKGLFTDDYWTPVYGAFRALEAAGFAVELTGSKYGHDEHGSPNEKVWTFQIPMGCKPLYGILTAHGAGTVNDPISAYDISAYVS